MVTEQKKKIERMINYMRLLVELATREGRTKPGEGESTDEALAALCDCKPSH